MKIKPFIFFFLTPPKLRSCETKSTGCAQNNERTGECSGLSASSWRFELLAAFCSFRGGQPQI